MSKSLVAALVVVLVTSAFAPAARSASARAWSPTTGGPEASATYVVQEGDFLYAVASRFGTTVRAIARANDLTDPDLIYPGQMLVIPSGNPVAAGRPVLVAAPEARASAPAASSPAVATTRAEPRPAATIAMTPRETALFDGLNAQRAARGLRALRFEPALMPVARARSGDMAARNYFSHTTPEGGSVQDLVRASGLRYEWVNEILARNNYPDDQSVAVSVTAFMNSANHRAHVLSPVYARAAVGEARTPEGMKYFTVMLASDQ